MLGEHDECDAFNEESPVGGKEEIRLHQVSLDLCGFARSGLSNRCLRMSSMRPQNAYHRLHHRPRVSSSIFRRRGASDRAAPDRAGQVAASAGIRLLTQTRCGKTTPSIQGLWMRVSLDPQYSPRENLYSVKGCRSRDRTVSPPRRHHSPTAGNRFTM